MVNDIGFIGSGSNFARSLWVMVPLKGVMMGLVLINVASGCSGRTSDRPTSGPKAAVVAPGVKCDGPHCSAHTQFPYVRFRTAHGIGCMGNVPPGSTPNPMPPPLSYSANDIGAADVPRLSAHQLRVLRLIQRHVSSGTLRIAWVDRGENTQRFIVFNANDGPCETWAPGYEVLNGSCNEYYEPGENPYATHAVPDNASDCSQRWRSHAAGER